MIAVLPQSIMSLDDVAQQVVAGFHHQQGG